VGLDDERDSASGSISNADKTKAGGKLPNGSSVTDRIKNGAQVANDAVKNAKRGGKK